MSQETGNWQIAIRSFISINQTLNCFNQIDRDLFFKKRLTIEMPSGKTSRHLANQTTRLFFIRH
jgi:hypothetical protein